MRNGIRRLRVRRARKPPLRIPQPEHFTRQQRRSAMFVVCGMVAVALTFEGAWTLADGGFFIAALLAAELTV